MIFISLVALVMALGTWLVAWWTLPIIAVVIGFLFRDEGGRAGHVALGATMAWAVLLVIDFVMGPFARLTTTLGGVMGVPGPVVLIVTLLFPAALSWSAAVIGGSVGSVQGARE